MKVLKDKIWQYEKHGIDGEVKLFYLTINWKTLKKLQKDMKKNMNLQQEKFVIMVGAFIYLRNDYEEKIYQCYKKIYRRLSSYGFLC